MRALIYVFDSCLLTNGHFVNLGARDGWVFKKGKEGQGYYVDEPEWAKNKKPPPAASTDSNAVSSPNTKEVKKTKLVPSQVQFSNTLCFELD